MNRRTLGALAPPLFALALALPVALLGCAHRVPPPVLTASNATAPRPPLLFSPPFALATPEDAVVRVVGADRICSGTLVEDDLVLTAHHCVVDAARVRVPASTLQIELGGDYLAWGTVPVRAVLVPPCGATGGAGDVALLVLERKLVGIATMTPRLDAPPRIGEDVDPIGFGRCATSPDGIHRHDLGGGPVRATTLETFVVNAAICPGDSGGPVVARGSHEVVGVVSESAMDGDERSSATTILARLDAYRSLFSAARQVADGADPAELPPLTCPP